MEFDDVVSDEFRTIGNIPWFRRQALIVDAESDVEVLDRYGWDGEFYWGVTTDALRSIVWRDAIAFDLIYLTTRGSMSDKVVKHVRDIHKGLMTMPYVASVEAGLDVDLWRCRTFHERSHVARVWALSEEQIDEWSRRYGVHPGAICRDHPFLKAQFRYEDRSSSTYWTVQFPWERRTLSSLGWFAPYHLQGVYTWKEGARDRLFPLIPEPWSQFAVCQGFRFEQ